MLCTKKVESISHVVFLPAGHTGDTRCLARSGVAFSAAARVDLSPNPTYSGGLQCWCIPFGPGERERGRENKGSEIAVEGGGDIWEAT